MPTLAQYKESLNDSPETESIMPLFEIIEDVFIRRESKALLLHNKLTMEDVDLNVYDKILFQSYQTKESQAENYAMEPSHAISEYNRKVERKDRASNNYFAFNSALTSLNAYLNKAQK